MNYFKILSLSHLRQRYGLNTNPILLAFTFCCAVLFSSCDNDRDHDKIPDDKDKCPDVAAGNTKDGCPVKLPELSGVHLFIETSASMGGYFNNSTEYKTVVTDLASKVANFDKPLDVWLVADSLNKFKGSVADFTNQIATTKIANQKSSELDKIFDEIARKTDSTEVSIFLSDCILSFPAKDVKKDWELNRTNASSTLKNHIYTTFSALKKRGQAASVYAFKSKFHGTYYDYHNVKTKLNGDMRPFYVWVIGSTRMLADFDKRLAHISTFHPEQMLTFGLIDSALKSYSIIQGVEKRGKWSLSDGEVTDVEPTASEPSQFCLALNLDSLPQYARDTAYLNHHLQLTAKGCKAVFTVKDKNDADKSKLKTTKEKARIEDATHVILVSVTEMTLPNADVKLVLPLQYNDWYKSWSVMDDRDVKGASAGKTFAFEHLINGVIEAFDTGNKNLIELSIKISK